MNGKKKPAQTYAKSGVDIEAGDRLVEIIKPLVRSTSRPGADTEIGGFGGIFDLAATKYKNPVLVSSTDGVGTKLKIASAINNHNTIGIDLVAMCVNDIVVQGAEPLFFLDYFATGKLDVKQAETVIKSVAEGCKQAGCALIGGETAEMPGIYKKGDYDLAGFAVGIAEKSGVLPSQNIKEDDMLIGLASSGVHSNGYSLVRHVVKKNKLSYDAKPDGLKKKLGDILITPTRIYVRPCLELAKNGLVKAMAHITGGGITENVPRVIPDKLAAEVKLGSWPVPEIFKWLEKAGNIEQQEMLRTFNYGIGMVLVIEKSKLDKVAAILDKHNEEYFTIGRIIKNKQQESCVVYV